MTAIIAGAETAYFSLTSKDIQYLKNSERQNALQVNKLLEQPQLLLATLVITNSFINIAIVITTNILLNALLPTHLNVYIPAGYLATEPVNVDAGVLFSI
ncbi:MAG: DUF21 domain-containing protein, partial [Chitinophagia bacterium]|nr:DUF21 domain-containing protein [Chitinophagia bacterium]